VSAPDVSLSRDERALNLNRILGYLINYLLEMEEASRDCFATQMRHRCDTGATQCWER